MAGDFIVIYFMHDTHVVGTHGLRESVLSDPVGPSRDSTQHLSLAACLSTLSAQMLALLLL